jgi:uncharacterized membrane protein
VSKPSRRHLHHPRSFGERAADAVASSIGSWRFIIGQGILLALWIVVNIIGLYGLRWDPAPFILLNLCLSFQAGFTAPVIMMSQNRQAAINQRRDDHEASEVHSLFEINQRQLEILEVLHEIQAGGFQGHGHEERGARA